MGVYLKNLKVPETCFECPLCYDYLFCIVDEDLKAHAYDRHPHCPLIELEEWNSYSNGKMYAPKGTFQNILEDERENDMGVIEVNRIDIRRVVEDACHDLISDDKLAELVYIDIMLPLEDYLDDCEENES